MREGGACLLHLEHLVPRHIFDILHLSLLDMYILSILHYLGCPHLLHVDF